MKLNKATRIVILMKGRFAGRKAVIVKPYEDGTAEHPFGHSLVVGIKDYPREVTKRMGKTKIEKRSRIKPFIQIVNNKHLLTTRFAVDLGLNNAVINIECFKDSASKKKAKSEAKAKLQDKYRTGKNKYFFKKMRF